MSIDKNMQLTYIELYKSMLASRESDDVEAELVKSGDANFLASSKGHEGSAILAPFLQKSDYIHCHYRDKALMLARGITPEMFFYSALAKAESHSYGRQMVSHMSARELNILSIVGPVGNNALQSAGIAYAIKHEADNPLVVCSMGDGTTQQGEVLEAIAESKRENLPVLYFIHNNKLAISTRTIGKTFFSLKNGEYAKEFHQVKITYLDGRTPLMHCLQIKQIIAEIRDSKIPQIIVFNVDRLDNHSNADNQFLYRSDEEVAEGIEDNDPLIHSRKFLLDQQLLDDSTLTKIEEETVAKIRKAVATAKLGTVPQSCMDAELPLAKELMPDAPEYRGDFASNERLSMLEAMRKTFDYHLATDSRVCILGEDVEDGKGDVFGVTRGLSTKFPERVRNSPLSESTIVGMSAGMALAGLKPVAFIQFADFMPPAHNQICAELATMYWRTNGAWQCPVIVFAACGAYRPGLGPFHSQTNEAFYAHIPGIDVYMPSNAADAVGMLNAAFKANRPSIFLYPKKLLNNASVLDTTSVDVEKQIVPIGKARIVKSGADITLIGWGNTVSLCLNVALALENVGIEAEVIDLRTVKPLDITTIFNSAVKSKNVIVVHEDNQTCGVGAEILALLSENSEQYIKMRRVVKSDTYVPCNFTNQLEVLPSYEKILTAAAEMLDLSLTWEALTKTDGYTMDVIGISPSDESVLINKIWVKVGDKIETGDILVDVEASKSAGEIVASYGGTVTAIYVNEGERATVGDKLLSLQLAEQVNTNKQSQAMRAILTRKAKPPTTNPVVADSLVHKVGISIPYFKTASRKVKNAEILANFPDVTAEEVIKLTGIENRYWLDQNESIIDVATDVALKALLDNNLQLSDISTIICATCTPENYQCPPQANLVLERLYKHFGEYAMQAYDVNAVCSGYINVLQNAHDYLQTRPNERVLVITMEALSKFLDVKDFNTAFLFGDAATATVVYGANHLQQSKLLLDRTYLSAVAEDGRVLTVTKSVKDGGIKLRGKELFSIAVKTMARVMYKCCEIEGVTLDEISIVVPHQANQRILTAVERHLALKPGILYSNIANYGNTSSCTIPIAVAEAAKGFTRGRRIAFCAFGGGFTAGAAILTVR